jgi:hypothetical protein
MDWQERVALMQYAGGITRAEAGSAAARVIRLDACRAHEMNRVSANSSYLKSAVRDAVGYLCYVYSEENCMVARRGKWQVRRESRR